MREKIQQLTRIGWVAHILRAHKRFENRLGNQFAGAITYFSVLAMVPILMVAFAAVGMTLTVIRPDMLDVLKDQIQAQVSSAVGANGITEVIDKAINAWATVALVGLISAAYAGAGWIANLKSAVRAQWTPALEENERKRFIVLETLVNFGLLLCVLSIGLVAIAANTVGNLLNSTFIGWLGWEETAATQWGTRILTALVTTAGAFALYLFLFRVLPQQRVAWKPLWQGSLGAAIAFTVVQLVAGSLVGVFSQSPTAAAFGPVIVLMLVLNIFARSTLFAAAWIATSNQPAVAFAYNECDLPLRRLNPAAVLVSEGHWEYASAHKDEKDLQAGDRVEMSARSLPASARSAWMKQRREATGPIPPVADPNTVDKEVAAQGVRVGMGTGYAVGAATGIGLGALLAKILLRRS